MWRAFPNFTMERKWKQMNFKKNLSQYGNKFLSSHSKQCFSTAWYQNCLPDIQLDGILNMKVLNTMSNTQSNCTEVSKETEPSISTVSGTVYVRMTIQVGCFFSICRTGRFSLWKGLKGYNKNSFVTWMFRGLQRILEILLVAET